MDVKIYTKPASLFFFSFTFIYIPIILNISYCFGGSYRLILFLLFALSNAGLPGNDHYRQVVGYEV